jgi:hypothetical protein
VKNRFLTDPRAGAAIALALLLLAFVPPAAGQSLLLNDPDGASLRLGTQFLTPSWATNVDSRLSSGTGDFYGVAPLAGRFGVTFRVPYSSFAFDVADGEGGVREVRSSGLGNVSYTVPDPASHLFPALAAGLQYVGGPVRPKVFWVRQLDREMRRVVDHSIGVGIEFVP